MREMDSVASYFLGVMLHALRDQPERRSSVLARAGIDPGVLDDPAARVPAAAFAALWLIQIAELGDEFFQLDAHGMPPGSFALICRGLIQEPTLGKALRQCLASFALFLTQVSGNLTVQGPRAVLGVACSIAEPAPARYAEETFLCLMVSLMCWLGGRRIPIDRARFRYSRPALRDDSLLWGFDLTFGAERTEVAFASRYLRLPVIQDLPALKSFLRSAPQWLVIRFRNQQGVAAHVYQRLRDSHYGQWPTLVKMAAELHLSPTTLRRQLEREGCSFQEMKDEVRRGIALERLRDTRLSITDVAGQVGFQEASAFHRAFKKWTGESPGAYRKR